MPWPARSLTPVADILRRRPVLPRLHITDKMTALKPIYIGRSDGKATFLSSKTREEESNGPTQAQLSKVLDEKAGVLTFYQELPLEHPRSYDWRMKLGGMLMRELGESDGSE